MFRETDRQRTFFDADQWCGPAVPEDSFYAKLSKHGDRWFQDGDYKSMYSDTGLGRPCIPPSLLVKALILQNYANVSDRELVDRIRYDIRFKVALCLPLAYTGFHPTLLTVFRGRLILHAKERTAFERSLEMAKSSGLLSADEVQAIDSMPVTGAAALQDTYTLLRTGIEKTLRSVDAQREEWEGRHGFQFPFRREKYLGKKSRKPDINWDDEQQKRTYLAELVQDAQLLIAAVDASGMKDSAKVCAACQLLRQLVAQDIEEDEHGPTINHNTKNRVISTNDPEMRHGRKSKSKVITGYKTHVTTTEKEIVTNVEVTPANIGDAEPVLPMVQELRRLGMTPKGLYGDGAYGGADLRAALEAMGIEVRSKEAARSLGQFMPKSFFSIDEVGSRVICPALQETTTFRTSKDEKGRPVKVFRFATSQCSSCRLAEICVKEPEKKGREIRLHYNERQLQKAREQNADPTFKEDYKRRLVVERVQGRLQSYGLRQGRYFGVKKTRLQALFTATANNFWRVAALKEDAAWAAAA